ncbi:MAG: hypothetical protein ACQUYJ_08820, partial [Ferruginibacter sp.]
PESLADLIKYHSMKKLCFILFATLFVNSTKAQQLTGRWYSADSSRTYEIKETGENIFEAVIISSNRKTDSTGYQVIKNLLYNNHKKRYEGVIYAVSDNQPAWVKISFDKNNGNKIILKLKRMFVLDVTINWMRITAS